LHVTVLCKTILHGVRVEARAAPERRLFLWDVL
jgi:hypothetical protein